MATVTAPSYRLFFERGAMAEAAQIVRAGLEKQARDGKVGKRKDGSPATLHQSGDFWGEVDAEETTVGGGGEADLVFRVPYAEHLFTLFPEAKELLPAYLAEVERLVEPVFERGLYLIEE